MTRDSSRTPGRRPPSAGVSGRTASIRSGRAFDAYFASKRKSLSDAKHAAQWRSTMESYVFPTLGDRPFADIEAPEVMDLLALLWFETGETARRVLQRMEAVSGWPWHTLVSRTRFRSSLPMARRKVPCVDRRCRAVDIEGHRLPSLADLKKSRQSDVTAAAFATVATGRRAGPRP